ncbi:MAG: hypothetical protein KDD61_13700 [Bdellovibrionales bacterium]|nr:hypothetical protein [Bdellovibrionales bacterium]
MKILLLALVIVVSFKCFAGFDRGNGGDAYLCESMNPKMILAEVIEAPIVWKIHIKKQTGVDPVQMVLENLKDLATDFPEFASLLVSNLNWVVQHIQFVNGVAFENLDDDLLQWIPPGCELIQVALQTEFYLLIGGESWSQMDLQTQSMLISHEAIYRSLEILAARRRVHLQDSRVVRLLNSYLWRKFEGAVDAQSIAYWVEKHSKIKLK